MSDMGYPMLVKRARAIQENRGFYMTCNDIFPLWLFIYVFMSQACQ
jgi:hypothetical protein